jgi:hypothetical protein
MNNSITCPLSFICSLHRQHALQHEPGIHVFHDTESNEQVSFQVLSDLYSNNAVFVTEHDISCGGDLETRQLLELFPKNIGWEGKSGTLSNKFVSCTLNQFSLEGVSLIYTANITHTLQTLLWIKERCERGKIPLFAATLNFENAASSSTKAKKSANCTPESTWQSMLCAVRGISKSKAKTISEQFPSVASMKKTLDKKNKLSLTIKGVGAKTEQLLTAIFWGY